MQENRPPKMLLPDPDGAEPYAKMVSQLIEEDLRVITSEVARTLVAKRAQTE